MKKILFATTLLLITSTLMAQNFKTPVELFREGRGTARQPWVAQVAGEGLSAGMTEGRQRGHGHRQGGCWPRATRSRPQARALLAGWSE